MAIILHTLSACIYLEENVCISIQISLMVVPVGMIGDKSTFVKVVAWRQQMRSSNSHSYSDTDRRLFNMKYAFRSEIHYKNASTSTTNKFEHSITQNRKHPF